MNIQKLMKQAQQMQEKLLQEQGSLELEVSVGGGMVTVKMNGLKQLLDVQIDREVVDPEDPAMLADLIQAAVNEAGRKVDEELQQKLGGMAGGLPGLF
jgi:DNA-binding YbaB/EbfC family protein